MSATGTPTPNLGLRIPLGTDPAAVEDINYNAGVLDTKIGAIGNDTVKGLLDHAGDEINALGDGLAIIANGNTHAAIAAGEFVFVRNHGSLATGLYKATTAIAANGALSSSNLAADSKGGLNSLSDHINNLFHDIYETGTLANANSEPIYSGASFSIPANAYYAISAEIIYANSQPKRTIISLSSTSIATQQVIADVAGKSASICGKNMSNSPMTIYLWGQNANADNNPCRFQGCYWGV
jgi:hypothetical protein